MNTTNQDNKIQKKLESLTRNPGVYLFKDAGDKVLYIGKAKRLRNRVRSYFQGNLDPTTKTATLVKQIRDIEIIETLSELEALILEAELIKKYRPKYNIALKDDKSYIYIAIRNEKVKIGEKKVLLPKVLAVRKTDLLESDISFGPYPDTTTARYVVKTIRKVLPYRDCSAAKFNRYAKNKKPCLYGHIGVCQAPCVGEVSPTQYRKEVKRIEKLLSGDSSRLIKSMEVSMKKASKELRFEEAKGYRDMLKKFLYIRTRSTVAQKYIDNPYLVEDLRKKSLQNLVDALPVLDIEPLRIECYDISNVSGKDAVGSMVVAVNGEIMKSQYRKFKIKRKDTPDDFGMMAEVLRRRFKNEWDLPDLIVLDGGKGQVSVVLEVLYDVGADIPLIGLAKKQETIVYVKDHAFRELNLPSDNEGLKLLQRLRDESHRFAQSYHHKLRLKRIVS